MHVLCAIIKKKVKRPVRNICRDGGKRQPDGGMYTGIKAVMPNWLKPVANERNINTKTEER